MSTSDTRPFLYDKHYELHEIEQKGEVEHWNDDEEGIQYAIIIVGSTEYWFRYTNKRYIIDHTWGKFIIGKNPDNKSLNGQTAKRWL